MDSEQAKPERLDITVHGRVQGVAFRYHTQRQARKLGVTGWVRNNPDGSVHMVAEGSRAELKTFYAWVRHGPDHARVDRQEMTWDQGSGNFKDFLITG